jgi:hypothetical protein
VLIILIFTANKEIRNEAGKDKKTPAQMNVPGSRLIKTHHANLCAMLLRSLLIESSASDNFFFSSSVNLAGFPCIE